MYKKINTIHFIGIGGIGMSAIAEIAYRHGYRVTGSDLTAGDSVRHLVELGLTIHRGHEARHVLGADLVVYSSAVAPENPELVGAREQGVPRIPRAEMLAELMRLKYGIAVAGAHGKTTTSSLIAGTLIRAELDPTVVVGGRVECLGGKNVRLGSGEFMVVEADESDGSFNKLSPAIAVVTNLDREHMDHYGSMAAVKKAFSAFLGKIPFYGLGVICGDDPQLRILAGKGTRRTVTYGFGPRNDYRIVAYSADRAQSRCDVEASGSRETLRLQVPGRHNALNAVAALAVADELSVPRSVSVAAIADFSGVQRRFHYRGMLAGVTFIDDYAHHPTEIQATLAAARERFPESMVRVLFQPHRYSRVEDLFDEFTRSFRDAETIAVTEIYAAGESPVAGVTGQALADGLLRAGREACFTPDPLNTVRDWMTASAPGDVILTLGAGDLPSIYRELFSP